MSTEKEVMPSLKKHEIRIEAPLERERLYAFARK